MLKKWHVMYDGDKIYSIGCNGPLFEDNEDEFPIFSSIPEGDMVIMLVADNIHQALSYADELIRHEAWNEEDIEDE